MRVPSGWTASGFRAVLSASYTAYLALGRQPTLEEAHEYWPRLTLASYARAWATEDFRLAMLYRGVEWDSQGGLSYEQSLLIDKLANPLDTRGDAAKLREVGVGTVEYAAWKKNPLFMRTLEQRATGNIRESVPAILNAQVGKAIAGNTDSAKLVLALDGRYDPTNREAQNLRQFLDEVLRIVQTNLRDHPDLIRSIGADLTLLGAGQAMIEAAKTTPL